MEQGCKKRNKSHTQTHDKNNTIHEDGRGWEQDEVESRCIYIDIAISQPVYNSLDGSPLRHVALWVLSRGQPWV